MKKIAAITGWALAALLALYLFITDYVAKNPIPTAADSTESVG